MPTTYQTIQKVRGFGELPNGWHFGSGRAPSADTLATAKQVLSSIEQLGFDQTDAFPGVDGEVLLTVYNELDYYEFTVECDGYITFLYERNGEDIIYQEGLTLSESLSRLADYEAVTWDSQELFTSDIMTLQGVISKASVLRIPAMAAESRSSISNVLSRAAARSAIILIGSTEMLLAAHQFTGPYQTARTALLNKIPSMAMSATSTSKTGLTQRPKNSLSR